MSAPSYGQFNSELTKAVRRVAVDSARIAFTRHGERAMDDDGFDHEDVLTCLRKGKAHGPEFQNGQLRANVIHRGIGVRVSIGGLGSVKDGDWLTLESVKVITVMKAT